MTSIFHRFWWILEAKIEPSWEGTSKKNRSKRDMKKELARCPAIKGQGGARGAPRDVMDAQGNFEPHPPGTQDRLGHVGGAYRTPVDFLTTPPALQRTTGLGHGPTRRRATIKLHTGITSDEFIKFMPLGVLIAILHVINDLEADHTLDS